MTAPASTFRVRYEAVRTRIREAEARFGRPPGSVQLLAVGKGHGSEAIRAMATLGQRAFGENYVDEASAKMDALTDLDLDWHFIGPVQSNKTRTIAERFAWVHSVDRPKILRRLAEQRPPAMPPLNCLVQVHIGGEASKAGAPRDAVAALVDAAAGWPTIVVRGLMCLPPPEADFARQRRWFAELRSCYEALAPARAAWDALSMGMSADLEAAIAEGATWVRIGTDLFGPRAGAA